MTYLNEGLSPRLIPNNKSEEDRATSAFLAVFLSVTCFRKALMKSIGRNVRKSGKDTQAFVHPSFRGNYSKTDIPDGLIIHTKSNEEWRATIEVKVKANDLDLSQVERYIEQSLTQKVDALITISNEMCISPDRPPLRLKSSQKKLQKLKHYHWSWTYILHTAQTLLAREQFEETSQQFILTEFVHFLRDPKTGVEGFKTMSQNWKHLVDDLKTRAPDTPQHYFEEAVSDWHQECADLTFQLSRKLGQSVTQVIRPKPSSPEKRLNLDVTAFKKTGDLTALFDVNDGSNLLEIRLEVDQRAIRISKQFDLPTKVKTPYKRIEHFIGKFDQSDSETETGKHDGVRICAKWPYISEMTSTTLFSALQDSQNDELQKNRLINVEKDTIQHVELQYFPTKVASKIANRKSVISLLEDSVDHFCEYYIINY